MFNNHGQVTIDPNRWELRIPQVSILGKRKYIPTQEEGIPLCDTLAHRQSGKTTAEALTCIRDITEWREEKEIIKIRSDVDSWNPTIAYLAETRANARDIVWATLKRMGAKIPGVKFNNTSLTMSVPRPYIGDHASVVLKAHRYHDSIRGQKFRKIILDEAQKITKDALNLSIMATLSSYGGILDRIGTASAIGPYKEMITESIKMGSCLIWPATMTGVFSDKELYAIREMIGQYAFNQEYMCDFEMPELGTLFAPIIAEIENDGDFKSAYRKKEFPLVAGVDVGLGENLAVWVGQVVNSRRLELLDFFSGQRTIMDLRSDMEEVDLVPDSIFLPHDAETERVETEARRTAHDIFDEVFPECFVQPLEKSKGKFYDVEVVKKHLHLLKFPSETACSDAWKGMDHLKNYRVKVDKNNKTMDVIERNGSSHAADALRYLMVGIGVEGGRVTNAPVYRRQSDTNIGLESFPITRRNALIRNTRKSKLPNEMGENKARLDAILAQIKSQKI